MMSSRYACGLMVLSLSLAGCVGEGRSPHVLPTPAARQGGYYGPQPQRPYYGPTQPSYAAPGQPQYYGPPQQQQQQQQPYYGPTPTPGYPQPAASRAQTFSFELANATIAEKKSGGNPWDGVRAIPAELTKAIELALVAAEGPNPWIPAQGKTASALMNITNSAYGPPDVYGYIQVVLGSAEGPRQDLLLLKPDSYLPDWDRANRLSGLVLDGTTQVKVHLVDKDGLFDDPIATVYVDGNELRAAVQQGTVYQVAVFRQHREVLFLGIRVVPER